MTSATDKELAAIIEALTALASAITWTQPNSAPSVESYLKDAWAAIDKLKGGDAMTDNRTTDLREKLTERGIEYTTNDHMGVCETSWNGFTAMQLTPGAKLIMTVTPEQAIAATLGSDTCVIESTRYIESDIPDSWYEFDLSCGHTVKSAQVPPNYCEECGKKIDLQGVSYV